MSGFLLLLLLVACGSSNEAAGGGGESGSSSDAGGGIGGSSGAPSGGAGGDQAGSGGSAGSAQAGSAGATSLSAQKQAAIDTATQSALCTNLGPFFWEIGDADGAIVSGSTGDNSISAATIMPIASGSKWIFGAYVVERFKTDPGKIDLYAMTMRSGYTSFASCGLTQTVAGCLALGENGTLDPTQVGRFFYGAGHFQKYAVDLGLGLDTLAELAQDIQAQIGPELAIAYATPQVAAAVETSPAMYATFLRKILAGKLAISSHLGESAVCTLPASCPSATSSPVPEAWHYSLGHWVEDDPKTGDGSFSSPGLYGFYPWIGSGKKLYGLLARHDTANASNPTESSSYWLSVLCGRAIRAAFKSGHAR